ncbi:porin family protein [Flavobacterium lindanitolerans]|jgi:hypothetical protein|uniref:porin family protein n=1 Tax=Flavobacterium lindanitolerans TaxID=428988 RepID=UPI0023F47BE2|nr:porin family protein [Flavobacterium lindanitolerans]
MKQALITLIAVFSCIAISFAQHKGKVEMGFNVGFNTTNISNNIEIYDLPDSRYGFNFGVSADYYFSDDWSIKAKYIFETKGWNNDLIQVSDESDPVVRYESTNIRLNYITIPLMITFHAYGDDEDRINVYTNGGPYIGFLMDAKETRFNTDIKDSFDKIGGGISYGVGIKIPASNKFKFFLEYESQLGLTEIFKYRDRYIGVRHAMNFGINFLLY